MGEQGRAHERKDGGTGGQVANAYWIVTRSVLQGGGSGVEVRASGVMCEVCITLASGVMCEVCIRPGRGPLLGRHTGLGCDLGRMGWMNLRGHDVFAGMGGKAGRVQRKDEDVRGGVGALSCASERLGA